MYKSVKKDDGFSGEISENKRKAKKREKDITQNSDSSSFKKVRHSTRKKNTTKERLLEWIKFYTNQKFGIWIECTKCKKWRKSYEYAEAHEVPEDWHCSMSMSEKGVKGSCDDLEVTEESMDYSTEDYSPGSIVWAKLDGFPWWPGMVEDDPDTEEYYWKEGKTEYYNITFLDDAVTHAWIPATQVCSFLNPPKKTKLEKYLECAKVTKRGLPKEGILGKYKDVRYRDLIQRAEEKANLAISMPIEERLQKFSFAFLYKGKWPAAKIPSNMTVNESLNDGFKEGDGVDSVDSDSVQLLNCDETAEIPNKISLNEQLSDILKEVDDLDSLDSFESGEPLVAKKGTQKVEASQPVDSSHTEILKNKEKNSETKHNFNEIPLNIDKNSTQYEEAHKDFNSKSDEKSETEELNMCLKKCKAKLSKVKLGVQIDEATVKAVRKSKKKISDKSKDAETSKEKNLGKHKEDYEIIHSEDFNTNHDFFKDEPNIKSDKRKSNKTSNTNNKKQISSFKKVVPKIKTTTKNEYTSEDTCNKSRNSYDEKTAAKENDEEYLLNSSNNASENRSNSERKPPFKTTFKHPVKHTSNTEHKKVKFPLQTAITQENSNEIKSNTYDEVESSEYDKLKSKVLGKTKTCDKKDVPMKGTPSYGSLSAVNAKLVYEVEKLQKKSEVPKLVSKNKPDSAMNNGFDLDDTKYDSKKKTKMQNKMKNYSNPIKQTYDLMKSNVETKTDQDVHQKEAVSLLQAELNKVRFCATKKNIERPTHSKDVEMENHENVNTEEDEPDFIVENGENGDSSSFHEIESEDSDLFEI